MRHFNNSDSPLRATEALKLLFIVLLISLFMVSQAYAQKKSQERVLFKSGELYITALEVKNPKLDDPADVKIFIKHPSATYMIPLSLGGGAFKQDLKSVLAHIQKSITLKYNYLLIAYQPCYGGNAIKCHEFVSVFKIHEGSLIYLAIYYLEKSSMMDIKRQFSHF